MATRGIVLHAQATIHSSGSPVNGRPNPTETRRYALYWDVMDWPIVNGLSIKTDDREDICLLREEGVLMETEIGYTAHMFPPDIVIDPEKHNLIRHFGLGMKADHDELIRMEREVQTAIFNYHNQLAPSQLWSIGDTRLQPKNQPFNQELTRTIELGLLNTLISPAPNVPMEDVLSFKLKRRSELMAFRSVIDEICTGISQSPDFSRSFIMAQEKLIRSVLDLNQVMNESKMSHVVSSLKVKLNSLAVESIISGVSFGSAAISFEMPALAFGVVGLAVPTVVMGVVRALMPLSIPEHLRDYSYLYSIQSHLVTQN